MRTIISPTTQPKKEMKPQVTVDGEKLVEEETLEVTLEDRDYFLIEAINNLTKAIKRNNG